MKKEMVRLDIVGITYNQIENGMYALVLEEEGGGLRLPIVIGYTEAQSIECMLQNIDTPRPLTHEFLHRILTQFGMDIEKVVIKQMESGTFSADVVLMKDGERHTIDARSSDGVAMAMRCSAPIFASAAMLERCGFQINDSSMKIRQKPASEGSSLSAGETSGPRSGLRSKTGEELRHLMAEAVALEDYEKAAEIKRELETREEERES